MTWAARLGKRFGSAAITTVIVVIGLMWLVPTFGLLIDSLRSQGDDSATGWWQAFVHPSQFTFGNYEQIIHNSSIVQSLWNTVLITVPATTLVVVLGSMAARARQVDSVAATRCSSCSLR
jgi:alpha-glucoside transport system permease protein